MKVSTAVITTFALLLMTSNNSLAQDKPCSGWFNDCRIDKLESTVNSLSEQTKELAKESHNISGEINKIDANSDASVAGVNGTFLVVSRKGDVYFVDGSAGPPALAITLDGVGPYSTYCSFASAHEACIVADSQGHVWRGPARSTGAPFEKIK